jgi:hypothetical protein
VEGKKGDACYYCASAIMQVRETRVSKSASLFYHESRRVSHSVFHHESGCLLFFIKVGASHIPYIERPALEWCVSISYPPLSMISARAEQWRHPILPCYSHVLTIFFHFWMRLSKNLMVMNHNSCKG